MTTPESDARNERELALLISLGSVLTPTKGLASREVEQRLSARARVGRSASGMGARPRSSVCGRPISLAASWRRPSRWRRNGSRLPSARARHCRCAGVISRWVRRFFIAGGCR